MIETKRTNPGPPTPRNARRAVALVDIIIAAVILGLALTVIIGMTGRALSAQAAGEKFQTAAMLIDEQLNLVLARGPDNYASRFPSEGQCDEPFEAFRYKLDITGGDAGDAYHVIATVTWAIGGRAHSAFVETLMAPRLGEEPDPDRRPQEPLIRY